MDEPRDALSGIVIGLAIEVHRASGPGLLESAYEECLCFELHHAGLRFRRQVPLPVNYKAVKLDCGYRLDVLVEEQLVLELKTVENLLPVHNATSQLPQAWWLSDWFVAQFQRVRSQGRTETDCSLMSSSVSLCLCGYQSSSFFSLPSDGR